MVRSTQHVVFLRFSHQKGHQHTEQRGLLHNKANAPAGCVHRTYKILDEISVFGANITGAR